MNSLEPASQLPRLVRFGLYEVDLTQKSLRKSGLRIKLQKQPFQILEALIEQPGTVVSREALARRLWDSEPPNDSEHKLNKAVSKIRTALGDAADNPRFIETRARQGYRFIAPVEKLAEPRKAAAAPVVMAAAPPAPAPERPARPRHKHSILTAALPISVVLMGLGVWSLHSPHAPGVSQYEQLTNDGHQKFDGIGTDSERAYFFEFRDGQAILAAVPHGGGTTEIIPTNLPPDRGAYILDTTPGGGNLLVKVGAGINRDLVNAELWVIPIPEGGGRPLPGIKASSAHWSPDGERLAYFFGPDLFVARPDGADPVHIASQPGLNGSVRWSPDGKRIRFQSGFPIGGNAIWEVSSKGGTPRLVFPGWRFDQRGGTWTTRGDYFLFFSPSDNHLWISREENSLFGRGSEAPQQLTTSPLRFRSPRVIPDGNQAVAIGQLLRGKLLRWDAEEGQFVPHLGGISADVLHYSADGQRLVYVDYPEGSLWASRCDGSDRHELVRPPMLVTLPRISPDGRQVAFMGRMPGEFWKIYLISISGGRPELLLPGNGPESDPNWSPDGSQLVYAPLPWEAARGETGIQIVDLKTHSVRTLPGSQCFYSPRWSPDGRYISAICQFTSGLALYDLEQEVWSVLDAFPAGFPAWSRDGSSIYLFHAFSRERGIYRADVATGKISKVASLIGIDVAGMLGPFGLSLDPNDAPVILSDESSQEIYSLNLELP